MQKFLKGAGEVIAFLVALAGLVYLLGGLVIALRLLFGGFPFSAVATTIGQLPRQLVVTTALLEVALPAVVVALIAVMVTGVRPVWQLLDLIRRGIWWVLQKLGQLLAKWKLLGTIGDKIEDLLFWVAEKLEAPAEDLALLLLAVALMLPAFFNTNGDWGPWAILLAGAALTYTVASLCWPMLKGFDPRGKAARPVLHAVLVFALFGVIALVPALLFASSLKFEDAQVCTTTAAEPVEGRLIGEGGGQLLIEQTEAGEQWVVNLPTAQITKSEYGEISAKFACKEPSEEEKQVALAAEKKAEEDVGPHGGVTERKLAALVRPDLYFDQKERWRPIAVNAFLDERFPPEPGHELCTVRMKKPECKQLRHLAQLRPDAGTPTWIDVHGNEVNGKDFKSPAEACHRGFAVDCNGGKGAAIYYRRSGHEGQWYWDFWWFYRYNDYNGYFNHCKFYCDDHEGDWEGMVVITTESLEPEITGAIYAAHKDRIFVPGTTLPTSEGHPLAYVAEGTHATYPFVCAGECKQYSGLYEEHFPEGGHDGAIAWEGNVDPVCEASRCVRALPRSSKPRQQKLPYAGRWAAWPGHWGASCRPGCRQPDAGANASPASPGLQRRFRCPWVANLKALPEGSEARLSGERRIGGWEREELACMTERARG